MGEGPPLTFAELLRRYRIARGLTQEELAERARLSLRGVSDLERGARRAPRKETILLLAEALKLPEQKRAALELAVRRHAGLSSSLRNPQPPAHTLPAQPTRFIGREREIGEVRQRLLEPDVRLLTLTGPGGVGKTRLALRVAEALQDRFLDGVYFVGLASIADPALIPPAVAHALGVKEAGAQTLVQGITEHLRTRQALLVLDSFEHLLSEARLVAQFLSTCPQLKVLVTSRAVLRLSGEHDYAVRPLALPAPGEQPSVQETSRYEAVQLFLARARAARTTFTLTEGNAREVAEICVRLDGLPLALELAAARVRLLPPRAMLARLDKRLPLLTGGAQDLPSRQQTLRATLDWSYSLLDGAEQELLARLAVFASGCTLEAAEAICGAGNVQEVVETLASLVDNSLVSQEERGGGDVRFGMLETVREYALERLESSGEAERVWRMHATFYLELAQRAEPELRGPAQAVWLDRLEAERDNLRAAMGWLLAPREPVAHEHIELAVRLGWVLWLFWVMRGHLDEGRRWMKSALERADALQPDVRAKSLCVLGIVLNALGTTEEAMPLFEESAVLFQRAGDQRGTAISLTGLGIGAMKRGDTERATVLLKRSVALYRESGDRWGIAQLLPYIGMLARGRSDYPRARQYFEEGLTLARELEDRLGAYKSLYNLALVAQTQGDSGEATRRYRDGLVLSNELGNAAHMAYCLEGLASVAGATGRAEHVARLLGAAEVLLETVGAPRYPYVPDRATVQRATAGARAQLTAEAFAAAWAAGRAMTLEQAAAYALGDRDAAGVIAEAGQREASDRAVTS